MTRPPSSTVGTTPLGFMSRHHFWSLPPKAMPTSTRSYASPHSSAHHSTFITLIELMRPQIFISSLPMSHDVTLAKIVIPSVARDLYIDRAKVPRYARDDSCVEATTCAVSAPP